MNLLSRYACYIYIGLWIMYNLQRILMLSGIVAQLIFVVIMAMSFHAFYQINAYYKTSPYIKWLNVMLAVLTIYGLSLIIGDDTFYTHGKVHRTLNNYAYLQLIYISVMPIYAFYYYAKKKQLTSKNITYIFFILLAFTIISYYQQYFKVTAHKDKEDIVNNIGFLFVPLIPMLSLVTLKKFWKYLLAVVMFGFIMLSMKRGAILTGGIMLLLFIKYHFTVRSKTQLVSAFSLLLAAIFVIYHFVINLYANNAFFQKRLALTLEGYSSQRDKIYSYFGHYYVERTSVTEFFWGHGAYGTFSIYGTAAHNDWLEYAIDLGLLGIMMYFIYWCVFVWVWKKYKGNKSNRQVLGAILLAYLLISFFSMSFGNMPLAATLCIGYCLAMNTERNFVTLYEDTHHNTRLS